MKNRLARPPCLVVVERVFWKAADVDDSVLGADVGPAVGRGFAAIVESGPHESAGEPWPRIAEAPPAFRGGASSGCVWVVGRYVSFGVIGDVDSASADGAHRLGTHHRLFGILVVVLLGLRILVVVADHVAHGQPTDPNRANGSDRHRSRDVESVGHGFHRRKDQQSFVCICRTFLVAHGPHEDAGAIAIAADKIDELAHAFRV